MNTAKKPAKTAKKPAVPARSNRKKIILFGFIGIALAAVIVAAVIVIPKLGGDGNPVSTVSLLEKAPAKVGSYRYVNACRAIPQQSYKAVFGYDVTNNSTIQNTYADGSRSKLARIMSYCTSDFGDTIQDIGGGQKVPGSVASILMTLYEYTDPKQAAADVDGLTNLKGQDVSLAPLGIDSTVTAGNYEVFTVDGITVANNTDRIGRFVFAYRNVSASIDLADLSGDDDTNPITLDYTRQVINKLVPVVKASIDNPQLSQLPIEAQNVGKPIVAGSGAKIIMPCDYFTSADFKQITGNDDDSTQLTAAYDQNPMAYADRFKSSDKTLNGIGDVGCIRKGYISTPQPGPQTQADVKTYLTAQLAYETIEFPIVNETVIYYKNQADAITGAKAKLSNHTKSYPDTKNTEVSGLGDYAAFSEYTYSSTIVDTSDNSGPKEYHLYAVKGSYLVDIDMYYASYKVNVIKRGTADQYKKAAELLLARLP